MKVVSLIQSPYNKALVRTQTPLRFVFATQRGRLFNTLAIALYMSESRPSLYIPCLYEIYFSRSGLIDN